MLGITDDSQHQHFGYEDGCLYRRGVRSNRKVVDCPESLWLLSRSRQVSSSNHGDQLKHRIHMPSGLPCSSTEQSSTQANCPALSGVTSGISGQCSNKVTRAIDAASEKVYFLSVGLLFSGEASQPVLSLEAGRRVVHSE